MSKPFSTETPNYHADVPLTPYQRARQEWDDRIGSARVQAKNWRFMAFLSMFVALILLVMLVISLSLNQNNVYVAQVTAGGQVVNVAPLQKNYTPTQAEEEYFLSHFIQLIRSVSLDPVVAKQNWLQAYQFLTSSASEQLNTFMQQHNPLDLLGKKTVSVTISNINPLSNNTYDVDWVEKTIDANGQAEGEQSYNGEFTLMVKAPTTQKAILQNPLGIYITNFHISTRTSP